MMNKQDRAINILYILGLVKTMKFQQVGNSGIESSVRPKIEGKKKQLRQKMKNLSIRAMRKLRHQQIQKKRSSCRLQNRLIRSRFLSFCVNEQEYNCSICLQLMIYPTSLQCGHSFCLPCIESFNKVGIRNECSLCRTVDDIKFYQIDKNVEKIVQHIRICKLPTAVKQEYEARRNIFKKELEMRGIKQTLKLNDQIQIKVKNRWQKGRIIKIYQKSKNTYYHIFTFLNEETHHIGAKSINLKPAQQTSIIRSNFILGQNIFFEHLIPRPQVNIREAYNVQQILWEFNHYSPPQIPESHWIPFYFAEFADEADRSLD